MAKHAPTTPIPSEKTEPLLLVSPSAPFDYLRLETHASNVRGAGQALLAMCQSTQAEDGSLADALNLIGSLLLEQASGIQACSEEWRRAPSISGSDTALLAACATYRRLAQTERQRHASQDDADDACLALHDATLAVAAIAPVSAAGQRAKAAVAFAALSQKAAPMVGHSWRQQAEAQELLAITTLAEIAGLPVHDGLAQEGAA